MAIEFGEGVPAAPTSAARPIAIDWCDTSSTLELSPMAIAPIVPAVPPTSASLPMATLWLDVPPRPTLAFSPKATDSMEALATSASEPIAMPSVEAPVT